MKKRWLLLIAACALLALPAGAHSPDRDYGNVGAAGQGYGPGYIMDGTRFLVTLDSKLETKKLQPGKEFKAKLAEDLVAPNGNTIPRGKKLKGHVLEVQRGFRGRVMLSFDQIETRRGWVPLVATLTDVPGNRSVRAAGDEGEIQKKGSRNRTLEGAAIGAAVGAGTGAAAGGGRGAIIGAAAGAAIGGTAGLLTDRDFRLDKGTVMELRLDRPLQVPR